MPITLDHLRADIDRGLRTRRFLGHRESAEWARQAAPIVAEIRDGVDSGPSSGLVVLIERAIGQVLKVILHADDSDGLIGDLARELDRAAGQRSRRLSRDQLAALVNGLGNLLDVLASAAPEDKAEVYRRLGLRLTYDPTRRVVTLESHLGPDGGRELSGGRRPREGSGPGASSADPVGESRCRRGDTTVRPTNSRRRVLVHGRLT